MISEEEHRRRAIGLADYVRLVTRLKVFQAGAVPTAYEAALDLRDLEALLESSGLTLRDPDLDLARLKTQLAGALDAAPGMH